MRKIICLSLSLFLGIFAFNPAADSATNSDSSNAGVEQAKADYRAYLQQLKALSSQYKEITGEMKKVIQEEGVPVWDDSGMGGIKVADVTIQEADEATFGDTDIQDTDKQLIVKVDLPGLKKDEIKVSILENRVLRISGRREDEKISVSDTRNNHYLRAERRRGNFERQIKLPVEVLDTGTEAKYENGVLTVRILKSSASRREVTVPVK